MTYQVLARKWRPQAFDAVVGQDHVTRTLRNALESGRVAHAYLLTGPRGVGKTTTARLLAKALACTERQGPEACGQCPACRDFASGAPVDVMEIDAASNTGVDDIRTLRENVKYAPARSRYKVYIVDEVHMLSKNAFNAFLKTLEEPPAHVVFILATTEPRQILPTVLSRCQRFDFHPIPPELLVQTLQAILTEEQIQFDPSALPMLVRAAEGSLRDALSLTDTAIAYGEGRLDEASVARLLGASAPVQVRAFVQALLERDGAAALATIDRAAGAGEDLATLARDAVELLRRLLVVKAGAATAFADLTPAESAELARQAEGVSTDELIYLLRAFIDADGEMRRSPHPRVELEVAAVRAARRPAPQQLDALLAKLEEAMTQLGPAPAAGGGGRPGAVQADLLGAAPAGASSSEPAAPSRPGGVVSPPPWTPRAGAAPPRPTWTPPGGAPSAPPAPGAAPELARTSSAQGAAAEGGRSGHAPGRASEPAPAAAGETAARGAPGGVEAGADTSGDELTEAWSRVIEEVMKKRALLGTVLQHAAPVGLAGGVLTVAITGSPFHKETLAERPNRELINQAVQRHVPGASRMEVDANGAAQSGARHHPTVEATVEAFQGEIVAIRPRSSPGEGEST